MQVASLGPSPTPVVSGATTCPGKDCNDNTVSPGLMGSGVVLLLAIAVVLLIRSFRTHINRVPASFDEPDASGETGGSPGASDPGGPAGSKD